MQEKTTNLTASMQGTLYEANFKNRHPCGTLRKSIPEWKYVCGTLRKSIPSGNTFAEHSANKSKNENLLNKLFFNYFINEKI